MFDNIKIAYKIMPFSIISKANGSHNEMFNFGFCSQSELSEDKAKEILGDMKKNQLKIDYEFVHRIENNII